MESGRVVIFSTEAASPVAEFLLANAGAFSTAACSSGVPQVERLSEVASSGAESLSLALLPLGSGRGSLAEDDALAIYAALKPNGSLVAAAADSDAETVRRSLSRCFRRVLDERLLATGADRRRL